MPDPAQVKTSMKLREHTRLSAGSRFAIWTRAAVAGAGAAAVAAGALIGATGHGGGPAHVAQKHDAVQPAPPMRLAALAQNEYWMVALDGGVFAFGAPFFGSTGNIHLNKPIVGMTPSPDGTGYWFVASDGGVFAFPAGQQPFYGSMGATPLNSPVVGMAATVTGAGYWLVAADGGIFNFGDAALFGSLGGQHIPAPIVGMASTPDSGGYWLVGADGSVYPFGDAPDFGSMRGTALNKPVVGIAATPDGGGYWLTATDGGVFAFGDAHFYGSTGNISLNKPIVGIAATQTGRGYWFVASDGGIFAYGDAAFAGSMGAQHLNQPVVGMAMSPVLFPAHTTVVSSAASVAADGVSQVTVTAESVAQDGEPLPGDLLGFNVDTSGCGTVTPDGGVTDLNGQASVTYTASTLVKSCSVSAAELLGPLSASTSIAQVAGAPAHVTATPASATSYTADAGNSGIPMTFTVTDAHNHPVVGAHVDFTTTLAHGTVSPTSGTTNGNGVVSTSLHDTKVESGVVTATVHGTSVHGSTGTISITGGVAKSFALTPPASATAGTAYTVAATASDAYGNPANPPGGDLAVGGTACDAAPDTTAASCPAPTFSAGTANLNITSYKAQSAATITLGDATTGATSTSTPATFAINPAVPKKLIGTSPQLVPVHLSDGTTPSGIFITAADAAQSATVTVTLVDQWKNTETGHTDTVTVNHANTGDGGSTPASFNLTNGVGSFSYNAPMLVSGAYTSAWGQGSLTWSDSTFTASPASVTLTTTNAASIINNTTGTAFNADQVNTSNNGFAVTFKALASGGGVPLGGVKIDYSEAGFDGMATPPFTDCNGNAVTSGTTAVPAGGTINQATVCPHPTKVNSPNPTYTSQGTVTGWLDGSPVATPINNTTSAVTVTTGAVHSLGLPTTTTDNQTAGTFTLTATATDAEGNLMDPQEAFSGAFSKTESVTCNSTTSTSSASIPNTWNTTTAQATLTVKAYVTNSGVVLTLTGATSGFHATYTFNVVPAAPASVVWSTAPTTFTADQGNTGVVYGVDVADGFCNPIGNQVVDLSTTLTGATLPARVTTANSTAGGGVIGRAALTLKATTVQTGTMTATAGTGNSAPTATTPTITITAGKVSHFTVDAPSGTPTVDTPYDVTVHAFDTWNNLTNPTAARVDTRSTALSPSPNGDVPSVPTVGSFTGGTATITGVASYLAQSSAVIEVIDTTTSDTAGGVSATTTSPPAYVINPGAATKVFATSTNSDYSVMNATFSPTLAGETAQFTVSVADDRGNFVTGTHATDHVKITLTGGATPDGGSLTAPNVSGTGADGPGTSVNITITLSNGQGQFTYEGPNTPPLTGVESGTITLTDTTDGTLTGLPSAITIDG